MNYRYTRALSLVALLLLSIVLVACGDLEYVVWGTEWASGGCTDRRRGGCAGGGQGV